MRKVHSIIQNEHSRMHRNLSMIERLQRELEEFVQE